MYEVKICDQILMVARKYSFCEEFISNFLDPINSASYIIRCLATIALFPKDNNKIGRFPNGLYFAMAMREAEELSFSESEKIIIQKKAKKKMLEWINSSEFPQKKEKTKGVIFEKGDAFSTEKYVEIVPEFFEMKNEITNILFSKGINISYDLQNEVSVEELNSALDRIMQKLVNLNHTIN